MDNPPLSLEELEAGRQEALANAADLVSDAEVLIANERWARALFLAQIAGEEIGKYIMLVSTAVELLAADYAKENTERESQESTLTREQLDLVCFEYVSS